MTGDGVPSHSNVWSADEDHARFILNAEANAESIEAGYEIQSC